MISFFTWLETQYLCDVCGLPWDDIYMVNDKVWRKSGIKNVAHLECLEKTLGRRLNYGDFTQYANTPVNEENPKVQERMNEMPNNWSSAVGGIGKRWDKRWD